VTLYLKLNVIAISTAVLEIFALEMTPSLDVAVLIISTELVIDVSIRVTVLVITEGRCSPKEVFGILVTTKYVDVGMLYKTVRQLVLHHSNVPSTKKGYLLRNLSMENAANVSKIVNIVKLGRITNLLERNGPSL